MIPRRAIILFLVWLVSATGWGCQVPVFRYALERWTAESYRMIVMHREPLTESLQKKLIDLHGKLDGKTPIANVSLEVVDVSKLSEQARWSLPDVDAMQSDPWLVLVGPKGNEPIYSAPCTPAAIDQVLDSPARRKWVERITSGASVVWVVMPKDGDTATLPKLEKALAAAEKEIVLPDGIMRPEDLKDVEGEIDLEDVLRSRIPLKISFEVMTLDTSDPREAAFAAMLRQGTPKEMLDETLVVPLFGRGRMLQPLPASRMNNELILAGCRYLCGACSCQVKDQNPGRDIVIQEDWSKHLQDGLVVIEKALPPLEGVGEITDLTHSAKGDPLVKSADEVEGASLKPKRSLVKPFIMAGGMLFIILTIGSMIVKRMMAKK